MCKIILPLTIVTFSVYVISDSSVPFITKCKGSDAKCITQSSQHTVPIFAAGLPEFDVPSVDPSYSGFMNATTWGLELLLYNSQLVGLKDCKVLKMERDVANSKLLMKLDCPVNLNGQYVMDGHFLFFLIRGHGDYHIKADNFKFSIYLDMEDYIGEDGKKHWKLTKWVYKCNVYGQSVVEFKGLFPGNKFLSNAANLLLKSNPTAFLDLACVPVTDTVIQDNVKNINQFFSRVPVENLSLDDM